MIGNAGQPTMKDNPSLPRHPKVLVDVPTIEELMHQPRDLLFHLLVQDHIVPTCILHLLIQCFTPEPIAIIDIHPLVPWWRWDLPFPNCPDKLIRLAITRHDRLRSRRFFEYVLHLIVPNLHDIDNEVLLAPFVEVFGESTGLAECVRAVEVACSENRFINNVESGSCVASEGEGEEVYCDGNTISLTVWLKGRTANNTIVDVCYCKS